MKKVMMTATATKAENYTAAMVQEIRDAAPLDFAKCEALAAKFGGNKTARSVIAKALREGIPYTPKPAPTKKPQGVTKAKVVENLASVLAVPASKLEGLDKAPLPTLSFLLSTIVALDSAYQDSGESAEFTDDADMSEDETDMEESENAE